MIRNLLKWSLQIAGVSIVSYNYFLNLEQQAQLYGFYRSARNSARTSFELMQALRHYKSISLLKDNKQQCEKQIHQVNMQTANRLQKLSLQNRGVYMRIAQTIGSMKSVFPKQFSDVLSKVIQDQINNQAIPYNYIKKYLQKQLGKSTKLQFQSLNTNPVRIDLFSQTYKGQLIESFVDVLVTILHPYAKAQVKYDILFLKKVVSYCNKFQEKYFAESDPLLLSLFLNNLQKSIDRQLNIKEEEQIAKKIKVLFQRNKASSYVPHYISQLTTKNLKIVQFMNSLSLENLQNLKQNSFDIKNLSFQIPNTFNLLLVQGNIIYNIFKSKDINIRKAWPNQTSATQFICVQNFSRRTKIQPELLIGYQAIWKSLIQKKVSKNKQQQKIKSIETFYKDLPDVLLYQVLKDEELTKQMSQKQIKAQNISKVSKLIQQKLSEEVRKALLQNKLMTLQKKKGKKQKIYFDQQTVKNYQYLSKTFEIKYESWKFQSLYNTYANIFKTPFNFGQLINN